MTGSIHHPRGREHHNPPSLPTSWLKLSIPAIFAMELLRYFAKFRAVLPQQAITPQSCTTDKLTGLPLELVIQICDLLSPIDLVCLCLCDHQLHTIFNTYYHLPTRRDDRLSIFLRLERDLPEYFACDICNILHRYDGSKSFGLSGLAHCRSCPLPCVRNGYDWRQESIGGSSVSMRTHHSFSHSRNRLSFLQIKLAIRGYCYGPCSGISTDSLAYTQVRQYAHPLASESEKSGYESTRMLFSIDAQICPEPLGVHVRMQDIILLELWEHYKIQENSQSATLSLFELCRHESLESKSSDIDSMYNGGKGSCSYTCPKCNTVSLIEFRRVGCKPALVLTRWVNLGSGVRRDDPLWNIHIYNCNHGTVLPSALRMQNPRECFENMASLSLEELRVRNISYLRDDRYKNGRPFAHEQEKFCWHISYKEPGGIREFLSFLFLLTIFVIVIVFFSRRLGCFVASLYSPETCPHLIILQY
ncbi:unnamed protein product [Penicillium olsonii]|uniref:F-box domain-containing protein n=1 Tax=Penicillium olsonii TaxID=99116 RepID=A0A9W4HD55_PENOL|nr:unnamed protein product [Penicillium olsonii]CAG7972899.1 unnamed protein product [Penicillium olsonii]